MQVLRVVTKLMVLYPGPQDPDAREERLAAYVEELRDIPWWWIANACRSLSRETRTFCPSVGEVRERAGDAIRWWKQKHRIPLLRAPMSDRLPDPQTELRGLGDEVEHPAVLALVEKLSD